MAVNLSIYTSSTTFPMKPTASVCNQDLGFLCHCQKLYELKLGSFLEEQRPPLHWGLEEISSQLRLKDFGIAEAAQPVCSQMTSSGKLSMCSTLISWLLLSNNSSRWLICAWISLDLCELDETDLLDDIKKKKTMKIVLSSRREQRRCMHISKHPPGLRCSRTVWGWSCVTCPCCRWCLCSLGWKVIFRFFRRTVEPLGSSRRSKGQPFLSSTLAVSQRSHTWWPTSRKFLTQV